MPALSSLPDASIYGNVQAPQSMSIQDLVNLGRSSTALQKEKALLQPAIQQGQAQAETATYQADTAKLDNSLKHIGTIIQDQQTLLTKPDLTANDIIEKAKSSAKQFNTPQEALDQAIAGIPKNGSPSELRAYLATNLAKTLGAQSQLEKMYPGGVLPSQLPAGGYQASPATTEGGYAPTGTQTTPKGVTADHMSQAPKSDFSKPIALSYPVRQAGQAFTALPQEEDERKIGTATKSALFQRQGELPQAERTIKRAIEKAQEIGKAEWNEGAGVLGSAGRKFSVFLGTEQGVAYKELGKDLAQNAIANIKAMGGSLDTVNGQQLTKMANGDETYPPKVLIEIAQRTQADMTALDSKATAMKKFADKFGDQNLSAFNQMWKNNADPDIFQLKNIFDDQNMSAKEKADARDKLIGKDDKQKKIFMEKWNNIKKLEQTGSL
jgi:hypothetical protein